MKEGTEIKRSEERVNNYVDAQFFPNTPMFLAISDRLMGYIIEDSIVKYKLSLDHSSITVSPLPAEPAKTEPIEESAVEGESKQEAEIFKEVEIKREEKKEPPTKMDKFAESQETQIEDDPSARVKPLNQGFSFAITPGN